MPLPPDSQEATPPLDPDEIHQQAAALALHLQRSGVAFLPAANAEAVESLLPRFASCETEERESQPESPEQKTTAQKTPPQKPPEKEPKREAQNAPASPPAVPHSGSPLGSPSAPMPTSRLDPVPAFTSTEGSYEGESISLDDRSAKLQTLADNASTCTACPVLSSCRTQTVFGEGNPEARFVFLGDGPGPDEDRSGKPFVSEAGQLLTKMIAACTLDRQQCYLLNLVKCRPPGNRNPEADEVENCRVFYQQQLQTIRPEYIICLGGVAAQELLRTKLSVGRLRGKLHGYFDSKVLVTYHPTYLQRNPAAKKAAWDDLQLMLADAGIALP